MCSEMGGVLGSDALAAYNSIQIDCAASVPVAIPEDAMNSSSTAKPKTASTRQPGMSYKFQRLREKIRRAVESGELKGKLPGERALARRFHVNAKTLSKALTDLAAEGLLDRSIGRGTFVKGSAPAPSAGVGRWLVLSDSPAGEHACTLEALRKACPDLQIVPALDPVRPSQLSQFSAVIDLAGKTSDAAIRGLIVRGTPLVLANHEPSAYSLNSVMIDVPFGVSRIARDLLMAGHRVIGAVERRGRHTVSSAARAAAQRYAPEAVIESAEGREIAALLNAGATALICGSAAEARIAETILSSLNTDVSVAAVGCGCASGKYSGYFVDCSQIADAIVRFLQEPAARPTTLWLAGTWTDRGSIKPVGMLREGELRPPYAVGQPQA